jgi:hypothetical protein
MAYNVTVNIEVRFMWAVLPSHAARVMNIAVPCPHSSPWMLPPRRRSVIQPGKGRSINLTTHYCTS